MFLMGSDLPVHWKAVMLGVVIAKAGILGASTGLALFGALDIASAIAARDWLTEMQKEVYFDYFAIAGGLSGMIWQSVRSLIFR
jgi:hypothetical protein